MAEKTTTPEAQYVKNILKYGNPYGPIAKTPDITVAPVRKYYVDPGVRNGVNALAQPQPPVEGGAALPNEAYGQGGGNILAQSAPNYETAGPGQGDVGNPAMNGLGPAFGTVNTAPKMSTVLTTAPKLSKVFSKTPFPMKLVAVPTEMAYRATSDAIDNAHISGFDPTGAIVDDQGNVLGSHAQVANPALSDMTGVNTDFGDITGMFGEDGIGGDIGGGLDGSPDAVGAVD